MTQPIMEEGRWAVLRNGVVRGPIYAHNNQVYPWLAGRTSYTQTGSAFASGCSDLDIIATFPTRAEAEAYTPRQPAPVASDAPAVDWDRFRREAALAALAWAGHAHWHSNHSQVASRCVQMADALIAALKGETK